MYFAPTWQFNTPYSLSAGIVHCRYLGGQGEKEEGLGEEGGLHRQSARRPLRGSGAPGMRAMGDRWGFGVRGILILIRPLSGGFPAFRAPLSPCSLPLPLLLTVPVNRWWLMCRNSPGLGLFLQDVYLGLVFHAPPPPLSVSHAHKHRRVHAPHTPTTRVRARTHTHAPVSYTHLTLPTIDDV